jgi:hypothetical protein
MKDLTFRQIAKLLRVAMLLSAMFMLVPQKALAGMDWGSWYDWYNASYNSN